MLVGAGGPAADRASCRFHLESTGPRFQFPSRSDYSQFTSILDGMVELDLIGENVFRIEGSAEEPDPERAPPTPNDLASARRRPRHESNIKQAANFHGPVDRYLRATLREILDPAFEIGRPVTWSDPRRLMAAPANLLTPQFELRPCLLVHADMFNRRRVKFGSPGCVALYLWSGYMPGSTIATQASRSI